MISACQFLIVLLVSDTAVLLACEFKVKHRLHFKQEHGLAEEVVRRRAGEKRRKGCLSMQW